MKLNILTCFILISVVTCIPVHIHQHISGHESENEEHYHNTPAKYEFDYSVQDEHTGDIKSHQESRKGDNVHGRYEFIEPDGHKRIVEYSVDKHSGFKATVHRVPTDIKIPSPQKHHFGSSSFGPTEAHHIGHINKHQQEAQRSNSGHAPSDRHHHQQALQNSNDGHNYHEEHHDRLRDNYQQNAHIPQVGSHLGSHHHNLPAASQQETDLHKFLYNNPSSGEVHSQFRANPKFVHVPAVFEDADSQFRGTNHYQSQINHEINALASISPIYGDEEKYVAVPEHHHFASIVEREHETPAIEHISSGHERKGSSYEH